MARIARAVVSGVAHHLTQRGNYRRAVFEMDADRKRYLEWLEHYAERYDTLFGGYCLMRNHLHLVAVPRKKDSLARTFSQVHMHYSQYFNRKHGETIWVEQFQKCIRSGRPFGKEAFVRQVTRSLRRNLKAPPLGRPSNKASEIRIGAGLTFSTFLRKRQQILFIDSLLGSRNSFHSP